MIAGGLGEGGMGLNLLYSKIMCVHTHTQHTHNRGGGGGVSTYLFVEGWGYLLHCKSAG